MREAEVLEILINGPGPFGFRLYGGEGDPLIVAKLRSRSKAHDAGLREGDVVLGINGLSCQTISHGVAMALLESADDALHLHLYRGSASRDTLSAVYQSLGPQLRPVPPGTEPPNRSIFTIQPTPEAQPSAADQQQPLQLPVYPHDAEHDAAAPTTSFSRQQEVTSVGAKATQTITTETETQDLGGVTLTKVTRQVVLDTTVAAPTWPPTYEPAKRDDGIIVQTAAIFHVPKIKAQPLLWQPENSRSASAAESGNAVLVNRPVTVDLSPFGGAPVKDDGAPRVQRFERVEPTWEEPATFKVPKTSAKPWIWQPSFVPDLPVRDATPALPFQALQASAGPAYENHVTSREEETGRGGEGRGGGERSLDGFGLSPDLIRVLTTQGPEDDWAAIARRRKIFADSSFYDDPEAKYPTIEEQIKMARKVALSLSAPDNVTARGQRMFMKRKEKANQWTSDQPAYGGGHVTLPKRSPSSPRPQRTTPAAREHPQQDLYYNPTPWKTPTLKKVEKVSLDLRVKPTTIDAYPENAHVSFSRHRALFERGVGQPPQWSARSAHYDRSGKKVPATGSLAPRPCHGLVNDLRGMRGKGAQLFAQRRAKLAEEAEEEAAAEGQHGWHSDGEVGGREISGADRPGFDYPDPSEQAAVRRLEDLISISKAYFAPWESTAGGRQASKPVAPGKPWKGAATDDPSLARAKSEQRTDEGSRPSFLGKTSGGGYRPVRFTAQSDLYSVPGVSEF